MRKRNNAEVFARHMKHWNEYFSKIHASDKKNVKRNKSTTQRKDTK